MTFTEGGKMNKRVGEYTSRHTYAQSLVSLANAQAQGNPAGMGMPGAIPRYDWTSPADSPEGHREGLRRLGIGGSRDPR